MIVAAIIWSVVLADLATLHLLWAARIWFSIREEAELARAVVGTAGVERMPGPVLCAAVALALGLAATLPWWAAFGLQRAALLALSVVFFLRGLAPFTGPWARLTPEEPFRRLDRAAFGPLCLALAVLAASLGSVA
ncbi:DUF3995 domain-containing protein [Jannaschia seohaensis]|uniref:Uncharacterized protein DUF3995 n=1 Tax=Jannaschia seohaensis TaxID=475081 RepID=A0A2Y9AJS8_9RHOB|nr:DUF3995 domain-containing protein [Jannaschia seohaensis]PWJ20484.1 uncharacterized protein DUF3995 [Jannaschia seohaensis]SSA44580.1 Protein of unknown function [Jannaschia seohaensis]